MNSVSKMRFNRFQPLISIIVPVYNVESYLPNCLNSILCQTYDLFELILVDDGSTDSSWVICNQYRQRDSRIILISQKNSGLSQARNTGLDYAKGELLTFVDSDDTITPDYLEYLLSLFSYSDECSIVACNHYIVRDGRRQKNSTSNRDVIILSTREAMEEALFHQHINVSTWAKMYKKDVFNSLRFPKGRLYEDTWIFGDLLQRTNNLVFGNKCCYQYEVRDNSIVNGGFSLQRLQYIEAAHKLSNDALDIDENLRIGGIRRVNHARLSTLRYMEQESDQHLAHKLRAEILKDAPLFIHDSRTPSRDKIGIWLLSISLNAFYKGWRLYSFLRMKRTDI